MTISEFARSRGVEPQAVSRYIGRHPEIGEHTKREGKSVVLLPAAEAILDSVYPLPKPVEVINGIPPEEHIRALNRIAEVERENQLLQKEASHAQIEVARLKGIEDKASATERLYEELKGRLEGEIDGLKDEIEDKAQENAELHREVKEQAEQINTQEREIGFLKKRNDDREAYLEQTERDIRERDKQIGRQEKAIRSLKAENGEMEESLEEAEARLKEAEDEISRLKSRTLWQRIVNR